jgi:hypothetical protein
MIYMNQIHFLNSTTFLYKSLQTLGRMGLALGLVAAIISAWSFEAPDDGVYKEKFDWAVINGFGNQKSNVDYVGCWVIDQLIAKSVRSLGTEPTHGNLVAMLNAGFQVDTNGVFSLLKYTNDDNRGLVNLRAYTFDFQSKKFKAYGYYADHDKYMKRAT